MKLFEAIHGQSWLGLGQGGDIHEMQHWANVKQS